MEEAESLVSSMDAGVAGLGLQNNENNP